MAELLGDIRVLLVVLEERGGELEAGLTATSPFEAQLGTAPGGSNLAFKTELRDAQSVLAQVAERRAPSRTTSGAGLSSDLLAKPCFVVPLGKRQGATNIFADRISVGRARNHDVVLRHPSVSKFHAWFEDDGLGGLTLTDAGSRNHTYVDDRKLGPSPVRLPSHAKVKFGSVQAHVASLDSMWELLAEL